MNNKIKYGRSFFEGYSEEDAKINAKTTMQEKIFQDLSITVNMVEAYDGRLNFYVDSNNKIQCDSRKNHLLFEGTIKPPAQVTISCINIADGRPARQGEAYLSELLVYPAWAIGDIDELYIIGIKEPLRYLYNDFICQLEKHPLFYKINYKEYAYDIAVKLGVLPLVSHQYPHSK